MPRKRKLKVSLENWGHTVKRSHTHGHVINFRMQGCKDVILK